MEGRIRKNCTHIINIFSKEESPKEKGNLYLSGVNILSLPTLKQEFKVNCVLTVLDHKVYNACQVKYKVAKRGIQHHKWFEIDDIQEESIYPYFEEAHAYLRAMLQHHNVLVHCYLGKSRSASIVISFLMKELNLMFEEARNYVKEKRDIVQPNKGFIKDLMRFQEHLIKGEIQKKVEQPQENDD